MPNRAIVNSLLLAVLIGIPATAQIASRGVEAGSNSASRGVGGGTVNGSVRSIDNRAVWNARVEVRNATGMTVASAYTSVDGSFEFNNLGPGVYEIVVINGLDQASERALLQNDILSVNLRLPNAAGATNAGNADSVSVAEMKVPEKAREECAKAQKALAKSDLPAAWKHVNRALAIHPDFAQALTVRALLKMDEQKQAEALPDLERAVELDRGYGFAFLVLGAAYNAASRFDDALRVLDRGLALSPTSWQGHFELGKAYVAKQNYPPALLQLDKAEKLAPKAYAPIHLVRANIYLALKNYPEAMSELEAYLERDPGSPQSAGARRALDQVKAFVVPK